MSKSREARAEAALRKWGSCQGQGELFSRRELSKAEPARVQTKQKDKK